MTDWVSLFKDLDDGMTQVAAGIKYNVHPKSISRKKKEMKKVTKVTTKVTLPKVTRPTQPRKQFFRVPIVFLSDYIEMGYNWLSSYQSKNNPATIRRRAVVESETIRLETIKKKEVDKI